MAKVVIISGSPTPTSRLNALMERSQSYLQQQGFEVNTITVASLPAEDLIKANWNSEEIQAAIKLVDEAEGVILASPVYKAAYTGVLKVFLDLLPQKGLEGKLVLPLFVGGSMAHLLSIDYALKPIVSALSGKHILSGVYAVDAWIQRLEEGGYSMSEELEERLARTLKEFETVLAWRKTLPKELV
ncbi:FMN reductase (NADPH) [Paenibacillus selenitireducens]|uniref:FMN reductase (NADPH) n=1 Tax=Paenibacillus selenitireducens TaxID=1324314 RepID=A0A1T2XMM4_9BACL|nr:NADPH-dependent FMN reductase [Paenibacillus selenitireducens]OPA81065.1 FMN reductase (NADPH) [Paenibacillus selenitireducens]